ncbi:exosome complex component RRP43-like [Liolophura sinensis]|uniref:exosome complex component RRP43-like n=1 Tax=Liolophura sinensis TaxID=3198878 RepID=UPI0031585431
MVPVAASPSGSVLRELHSHLNITESFWRKDVRPDGRELGEVRHTILNVGSIGTAEGSALVKLGNTTVLCGVKAELTNPKAEEPKLGFIVPNVELSPLCAATFRPGPPSEQAQVMSQFVNDVIVNSKCVDREDLLIAEGKLVWVLYCDMLCLDYDGNISDACLLALVAALKNTELPLVTVDEETDQIMTDAHKKMKLRVHSCPVSTTFSIFEDQIVIADPTNEEESLTYGVLSIVTVGNKLCAVHKPGGHPLPEDKIEQCIDRAFLRCQEISQLIEDTVTSVKR